MNIRIICNKCKEIINEEIFKIGFLGDCGHVICNTCLYIPNYYVICKKYVNFEKIHHEIIKNISFTSTSQVFQIYTLQINALISENEHLKRKNDDLKKLLSYAKTVLEKKTKKYIPYFKNKTNSKKYS